jgi:hypothetical protein
MEPTAPVTYELWRDIEGFAFFPSANTTARDLLRPGAALIWSCTSASWDDAQRLKEIHIESLVSGNPTTRIPP